MRPRNAAGKATDHMLRFLAPLFCVAVSDIEVVFGRENVNKQLRMRAPKKLPAVFAPPGLSTALPDDNRRRACGHRPRN